MIVHLSARSASKSLLQRPAWYPEFSGTGQVVKLCACKNIFRYIDAHDRLPRWTRARIWPDKLLHSIGKFCTQAAAGPRYADDFAAWRRFFPLRSHGDQEPQLERPRG
jgi:hypothetical protein